MMNNSSDEIPNLSGVWRSRYEYGEGQSSEHTVDLRQRDLKVDGSSRLDASGSELFFHLRLIGASLLGGEWKEITSKKGTFRGREFTGWVAFSLKNKVALADGWWIGSDSKDQSVNNGKWTLEKQADENAEV